MKSFNTVKAENIAKEIISDREKEPSQSDWDCPSGGFFSFRTMITPAIIKGLYVLGVIALIIVGIVMMVNSDYDYGLFIGLGIIWFGNILWRLICEGIILMFSVHEILGSIERKIN